MSLERLIRSNDVHFRCILAAPFAGSRGECTVTTTRMLVGGMLETEFEIILRLSRAFLFGTREEAVHDVTILRNDALGSGESERAALWSRILVMIEMSPMN